MTRRILLVVFVAAVVPAVVAPTLMCRRADPGLEDRALIRRLRIGIHERDRQCAQLIERDRLDPAMKALLDNLDLVAAGELGQLRRRCGQCLSAAAKQ